MLKSLQNAAKKEGALVEIIAPKVGGVTASDGSWIEAAQKIDGGPSVLYDAVVLLPSDRWRQGIGRGSRRAGFRRGCLCASEIHRLRRGGRSPF